MQTRLPARPRGSRPLLAFTILTLILAGFGGAAAAEETSPGSGDDGSAAVAPSDDVTSGPTLTPTPSPTTTTPTPSPTTTTPTPPPTTTPVPRKQTVKVTLTTRSSMPAVSVRSRSGRRTVFVLQRHDGRRWVDVRTHTSDTRGRTLFTKQVPFSTLRVRARASRGWSAASSATIDSRKVWSAGYRSLRIKSASVAVTPLGGGRTFTVGDHRRDYAWSTIKVPIVVAADARRTGSAADKSAALRYSNNDAARRVYASLGPSRRSILNRHLRAHGDASTRTSAVAPGLTSWHVSDQARYASRIACGSKARSARAHMKQARPSYPFGLLQTRLRSRTIQKIGYGGSEVRQLAIVTLRDGRRYGVSILGDGGFGPARDKVDRIARWVAPRLERLPARRC